MTEHTQIKQNKYSTHDKPKFEFTENTASWTLFSSFLHTANTKAENSERGCRLKHHELHKTRTYVIYIYQPHYLSNKSRNE